MESRIEVLGEAKNITGIFFSGRLDVASRELVKAQLHEVLDFDTLYIIANLKDVSFIDSSGLSALVSGLRVAREQNKDIILVGLNKQAQMVFNLTMMDRVFAIYLTMEEALDSLQINRG